MEERVLILNLRKKLKEYSRLKRAKKAIRLIKDYTRRFVKVKNVKLSNKLNEYVWSNGIRNPPKKIKVKVIKEFDLGKVYLFDEKIEETKAKEEKPKEIKKESEKKEENKGEVKEKKEKGEKETKENKKDEVKKNE